ncbi:uncharacterized protein [Temnothorax longispinosus]|uniref:uncharacterized protein n=1 Tax=Temnothorax longispinosus TaxID=300112 RepID=UPI003A99CA66
MAPGTEDERQKMLKVPYREAVGMLMFAACVSRPDVMYAVSVVSRYSADPGQAHWTAVKKIICYLRDTVEYNIVYDGSNAEGLKIYSDSDYAADPDTRRSRSGYVATLAGGAVSWSSEMQPVVALSTTEAEYVAACGASKEAIWLRRLLKSVGVRLSSATKMYLDNQGSIKLIRNPEFHKRTKHIAVPLHSRSS